MIRLATVQDAPRIAEINVSSWRFAYKDFVSEKALYGDFIVENRIAAFKNLIQENRVKVYVYEDDHNGVIKGMMGIAACADPDKADAFEIHFLYIEPVFSRQGIGSSLIKYFEETGRKIGYTEFIIWSLEQNEIGKNCYYKNGYALDGKTKVFQRLNMVEIRFTKTISA